MLLKKTATFLTNLFAHITQTRKKMISSNLEGTSLGREGVFVGTEAAALGREGVCRGTDGASLGKGGTLVGTKTSPTAKLLKLSHAILIVVTGGTFATGTTALAQLAPPNFIDLGTINVGSTPTRTLPTPISQGQTVWYGFKVSQAIDFKTSWLDINTVGSSIATNLAMYDAQSYLWGANIGFGAGGNAAGISIGAGSGKRLGDVGDPNPAGRLSIGQNLQVGWPFIPRLTANRQYFIAVIGAGADFSQSPNPNWTISTSSTATGFRAPTRWDEGWNGIDAGIDLDTAQTPEGTGSLTQILTAGSATDRDMFKINICDPTSFRVTATPTRDAGGTSQVRLYILNSSGRGVAAINNTIANTTTTLTLPPGSPSGDYYLAWASNCPGAVAGTQNSAYDASGAIIWDFALSSDWNVRLAPNGPGAANPLAYWAFPNTCAGSNAYWVSLDLVGACYVYEGCDDVDFNNNGIFPEDQDIIDFLNTLAGAACP
jgi:hypothetical protein